MTHHIFRGLWVAATLLLTLCSCETGIFSSATPAERAVDSFATAYFNYQFATAVQFVTPESERWIVFAASNVHQDDVDSVCVQPQAAHVDLDEVVAGENDTVGHATVTVSDYFLMDSIGQVSHYRSADTYRLDMAKRHGRWLIHLAAPLRPEKEG